MNSASLKNVLRDFLPHGLIQKRHARWDFKRQVQRMSAFYKSFVAEGDLVFDVGANMGNRVHPLRLLGARVIAVEPQTRCVDALRADFGADADVTIIPKALGSLPGRGTLQIGGGNGIFSTLSSDFIDATSGSGRFPKECWESKEEVTITTLDQIIADHGQPRFIKIDVEGYEREVLGGLSVPIDYLSLEYTPELNDKMNSCLSYLEELGPCRFNLSWCESMAFSLREWCTREQLADIFQVMRHESWLFGDIYVRFKQ